MVVYKLIVGIIHANCYIVETEKKNAVIIDPGAESNKIMDFVEEKGLTVRKILVTHGHFDHIGAISSIVKRTGAPVYIHPADASKLQSPEKSLANLVPEVKFNKVTKYTPVFDEDDIKQDELVFHVIHTPGHSKGSVCFVCNNFIFSGDTLFCGSVGRTDFPDGSLEEIKKSVNRLADLEGDYTVFCGHEKSTTLDEERATNVYIKDNYYDNNF